MNVKRAHVVIPDDTIREIDRMVGKRKRSQFIADVLRERLRQLKMAQVIDRTAGAWKDENHPEFQGEDGVIKWVENLRREGDRFPLTQPSPTRERGK